MEQFWLGLRTRCCRSLERQGNEVSEWIEDIKNDSPDLFSYVTDAFREWDSLPDYDEIDNEWTMTIIEIGDGGAEKILASTSVWESELAEKWFND